ncbi:KfrB domain-containing protein [Agrobacterium tumefaciens]|uniref:KfrB domain-containing protein n=1 Tax=Agrobacterium tumefaciens TaxID=358 RepID=UPI001574B07E|nr:DUF6036 family nucleotidyltransferase [Agrobacterium tumefaciens]NTB05899.1 hypothetical protein [Agrobacterium tumefaciens]
MKFEHLEHLLRASGKAIGETQFFVIGSQSVLGKFPDAPQELLWSAEVDLIAKNKPKETEKLDVIGELSPFHDTHGYYVDPVSERTAILPRGWKGRLINVHSVNTEGVTGLCLDPHDLFVSKVAAGRDKDFEFVKIMIEHRMVDRERVLKYAAAVVSPEDDPERTKRIISRIEGLYNAVPVENTKHINEESGRYTGQILSLSNTVVQQDVGRGECVFHEASKIDRTPELGKTCTIQYARGKGIVVEKTKDKGHER